MEANKRKVSAEELGKLSDLFLIPADELLSGKKIDSPSQVFARNFESLGESDQQEILNLMKFKQAMKERQ